VNRIIKNQIKGEIKKQHGASMWSILSIVTMIGFIAMLAFKVVPDYFEHSQIRSTVQALVDSREFNDLTNGQITSKIQKRLMLNNVRTITAKGAFKPMRGRDGEKYVMIDYTKVVPIMSNLSATMEFKEEIHQSR
jgi:hypothetical protein